MNSEEEDNCVYICSEDNEKPLGKVTVKFRITDALMVAQTYPTEFTINDVKIDIGHKFGIPNELLLIRQCGYTVCNDCKLYETATNEFGIIELILECLDPEKTFDYDYYCRFVSNTISLLSLICDFWLIARTANSTYRIS